MAAALAPAARIFRLVAAALAADLSTRATGGTARGKGNGNGLTEARAGAHHWRGAPAKRNRRASIKRAAALGAAAGS